MSTIRPAVHFGYRPVTCLTERSDEGLRVHFFYLPVVRQRTVIFGKPPAVGPTSFGFAQGRLSHNAVYECMVRFADTLQIVSFPAMAC